MAYTSFFDMTSETNRLALVTSGVSRNEASQT